MVSAQQQWLRRPAVTDVRLGACGKTSLLCSFALGEFPKEYQPTIFENYVAEIRLDGKAVQLALWDTAGQEEYERLRPLSYSKSHVILIAFAIDTMDSFENVSNKWIHEVRDICGSTIPVVLVGCKADLRPPETSDDSAADPSADPSAASTTTAFVSRVQAERLAAAIGARTYKECSALRAEGVDDVFEAATRLSMLMRDGVPTHAVSEDGDRNHHHRRRSGSSAGRGDDVPGRCCVVC